MRREFHILSSDGVTLYPVSYSVEEGVLKIYCGCPAGLLGKWCKHKANLITQEDSKFINVAPEILDELHSFVSTTQFPKLIADFQQAERDVLMAKNKVENTKKTLGNAATMGLKI